MDSQDTNYARKKAESYPNAFDVTKVWKYADYPLIEVGQLELNKNPDNYFAEVEQSAFSPSNFVHGIGASPDRMLQARLFAYPDAQRYRLGTNFNTLHVNAPRGIEAKNYQRDGLMTPAVERNKKNYGTLDNSKFDGNEHPSSDPAYREPPLTLSAGSLDRYDHRQGSDDYTQAGDLYRLMNENQKNQLINNIVGSLGRARVDIQKRMLVHFEKADSEYGRRVQKSLNE